MEYVESILKLEFDWKSMESENVPSIGHTKVLTLQSPLEMKPYGFRKENSMDSIG